jgi:hypothetical protein
MGSNFSKEPIASIFRVKKDPAIKMETAGSSEI